jgi:hypothetical protein
MSQVLIINLADRTPTGGEQRMRLVSRTLTLLFTMLLGLSIAWALGAMIVVLLFADHALVGPSGVTLLFPQVPAATAGTVRLSDQSFITRLAGIADVFIATAPIAFVCLNLRGLFRLYANGIVFARENALHLKRIGVWLLVYPFAKTGANLLFRAFGGTDTAHSFSTLIEALLLGAVVFVIAQVMEMGHEIERERAEFV